MEVLRYPDIWKGVLQNELARALSGEGPADFFAARATYERMAAERDRLRELEQAYAEHGITVMLGLPRSRLVGRDIVFEYFERMRTIPEEQEA